MKCLVAIVEPTSNHANSFTTFAQDLLDIYTF